MEDDIQKYLPTVMLSGTPGSLIINLTSKKSRLSVSVFIDFIQRMYTSEKSKKKPRKYRGV